MSVITRTTTWLGGSSLLMCLLISVANTFAAEGQISSPNKLLNIVVSDDQGLRNRVEVDGKTVLTESPLGLVFFADGTKLGPAAVITGEKSANYDGTWENRFGNRRIVPDRCQELHLTLEERKTPSRTFGLIVRVYDDGVAFRDELPVGSRLGNFILADELTEFRFAGDHCCWPGDESTSVLPLPPEPTN